MPIVFWASLEPWANAMQPAEKICSRRNPRVRGRRVAFRNSQCRPTISDEREREADDRRGHQRDEHLVADPVQVELAEPGRRRWSRRGARR